MKFSISNADFVFERKMETATHPPRMAGFTWLVTLQLLPVWAAAEFLSDFSRRLWVDESRGAAAVEQTSWTHV